MSNTFDTLLNLTEGDVVSVVVEDFENTISPKEENPREINGEIRKIKSDVGHSAGEIIRTIVVGNPWEGGANIDCGDTGENKMVKSPRPEKYTKVWRPRSGKDRILLGRVRSVSKEGV